MSKTSHHPHHHHQHSHAGHHHHHHSHGTALGRMTWAFALNLIFAIIELVGGLWTNSVAILSDALHDFGDAVAVAIAIGLEKFSQKAVDAQYSYGYRRFSTLGALITGVILIAGSLFILIEAVPRLINPQKPHAEGMILLALLGLSVNGYAAYRVSKGESLNERMLMWHMLEDVAGWGLVLVGAIVMKFFGLPQLDAALAILLSLWILYNVFKNLREALQVFLMGAPTRIHLEEIHHEILKIESVRQVHHAHLWSLDGESHVYTAHLVFAAGSSFEEMSVVKKKVKDLVKKYGIVEASLETEWEDSDCADPEH